MRLWLSKSSEVPIREQLEAQIILGILSNDLTAGQRLPSTREIAQRYKIHSNTVSAAYRQLSQQGWVESRRGSGVYVRARSTNQPLAGDLELDQLISLFLKLAREKGFSLREIQSRLRRWLALQPPDHFLVIEADPELRQILIAEIEEATGVKAIGILITECSADVLTGAAPVTMYRQAEQVRAALPLDLDLITLRSRSVPGSLQGEKRPAADALIAIVSRWPEFLRWSHTMLVAAGLDPDALSFRDACQPGWHRGLRSAAFVITDSVMVHKLPSGCDARVFKTLSDSSINELQQFAKQLIRH